MAFNFPNTPTVGDVFTPSGGPSWWWTGEAWITAGVTLAGIAWKRTLFTASSTAFQYDVNTRTADVEVICGGGGWGVSQRRIAITVDGCCRKRWRRCWLCKEINNS